MGTIWLKDSLGNKQRGLKVDDTTKRMKIVDPTGADIMDLEAHASRHAAGGADPLPDNSIVDSMIAKNKVLCEIAIPLVTEAQSVTSTTLTTLNGQHIWNPSGWNRNRIVKVEVELEWESGGSGDIDLYNVTDGTKLADLVAPTAATAKTIQRIDVTSAVKGLTASKTLAIQAAGDGTNAVTVYSAKLIVTLVLG